MSGPAESRADLLLQSPDFHADSWARRRRAAVSAGGRPPGSASESRCVFAVLTHPREASIDRKTSEILELTRLSLRGRRHTTETPSAS